MNNDAKMGLGAVALIALCCGGPLILSLLASGAVLGALGAVWGSGRLLLAPAVVLAAVAVWLLARRRASQSADDAACCAPGPSTGSTDSHESTYGRSISTDERAQVQSGGRPAPR